MRKAYIILLSVIILSLGIQPAFARFPWNSELFQRIQFGAEIGYAQQFYKSSHYNILSEQGNRIDESSEGMFFHSNGSIILNAGYDISNYFNIALCAGYIGISEDRRIYPITLRLSYFPKTIWNDGLFVFAESGIGFEIYTDIYKKGVPLLNDAGVGYRVKLFPFCNLDFMLSLRGAFDHPLIPKNGSLGYVEPENIRSNDASYYSLIYTIALNF